VNLPHIPLSISALTDKDRKDLQFAFENDLDYVALSFVRHAKDISELLDLMKKTYGRRIPVIAKIEKPEALKELDNIIDASDAVMVARGDLGVETSPQEVPIIQKNIIRKCNIAGKPVITATQMLESMVVNPRPTRAEANDVANAILDGSDAVMLSSETAAGKYPVEAVKMMRSIASEVESSYIFRKNETIAHRELVLRTRQKTEEAVSHATIELAEKIGAKYIVTFTHSGGTARNISKYRPLVPVIAFSPIASTVRRLSLVWGVRAYELGAVSSADELLDGAAEVLKFKNMVAEKDHIVVTAGVPVGVPGSTNMIKVVTI
jgi:pyruvate kinase